MRIAGCSKKLISLWFSRERDERIVRRVTNVTMIRSRRSAIARSLKALANISWVTAEHLEELAQALSVTRHEKRSTIFSDKHSFEAAHLLLSGVARITCANRKGQRTMAILLSPGLIPAFPTAVTGIFYDFRCEAVTSCEIGTIGLDNFMKICLGIGSADFRKMAASFLGRWDRVHLRCANLIGCTIEERLALTFLDLTENFGVRDQHGGVLLDVPLRQGDLAEMVGASRPRVAEHLRELTRKHLISRKDQRVVVDDKGLKGFLMETNREGFSGELR
jgi:CRP-like cAMP-binding protein